MSPVLDTRPRILGMTRWPFAVVFGLSIVVAVVLLIVTMTSVRGAARVESALSTTRPAPPEEAPSKPRVAGVVRIGDTPTRATIEARRGWWYGLPLRGVAAETAAAGDDGAFRFETFPEGWWQLAATTPDGRTGFRTFTIGSGDTVELVVEIPEGPHRLIGRVVRYGAFHGLVALTPFATSRHRGGFPPLDGGTVVKTDAHGNFAFNRLPTGRFHVAAYHPRFETVLEADVDVPTEKPVALVASEDLGCWLRGRVTRRGGTPVEGASVGVETRWPRPDLTPIGVTAADGTFDCIYFRDGDQWLLVTVTGGPVLEVARFRLPPGDAILDAVLGTAITGRTEAPTGTTGSLPVEIGTSPATGKPGTSLSSMTSERFVIPMDDFPCRLLAVSSSARGLFVGSAIVAAPDDHRTLTLERLPDDAFYVSVGGLEESGVWSGSVVVHQQSEERHVSTPQELDANSAVIVSLIPGCRRVWIENSNLHRRGDARSWPSFVTAPLDVAMRWHSIQVPVGNLLDLSVRDPAHSPVAGTICRASPPLPWQDEWTRLATTDRDGSARMLLGPTQYVFVVPPPPFAPEAFAGPGALRGPATLTLARGVDRTIAVRARDGKPVAGAAVHLQWLPAGGQFVDHAEALELKPFVTGEDGRVTIPRTDPNRMYLVTVLPPRDPSDARTRGRAGSYAESWSAGETVVILEQP